MCDNSKLQQHIRNLTNDGEVVARFLVDTVEGRHTDARYHHKLEAAKLLERYGFTGDDEPSQFWGLIPTPEELAVNPTRHSAEHVPAEEGSRNPEGRSGETENSKLATDNSLNILNYEIAHLIRQETGDGHTIAQFLSHVMTRRDKPYTPRKLRIRHTDRMKAAMEILRRGHGHFGRRRKLVVDDLDDTNDYDTLHTDLAKRMREYNEHGTDAVRFLLDVMDAADPDAGFTWNHRVSAAQELIRRGWDTNYDNITPDMLQAYWQNQHRAPSPSMGEEPAPSEGRGSDGGETPESSPMKTPSGRGNARLKPPLPRGEGWGEGEISIRRIAPNNETIPTRHSAENAPTEAAKVTNNTPSPSMGEEPAPSEGRGWDGGEEHPASSPSCTSMSDVPDCYYEPLTPEDQAIFDYQSLIESGEFAQGEISIVPPTDAARQDYAIAFRQIREAAESEGVPLLPNPLAGTLRHPTIRSP